MHQLAAWGERHRVPVVLHGALHPEERWAFDRSSIRRSCVRAAGYAANSAFEARYVEGLGVPRRRITVVGAGVDPDALKTVPRAPSEEPTGPAARPLLRPPECSKRADTVVEALPTIWSRHPTVEVVIAVRHRHAMCRRRLRGLAGLRLRWLPDAENRRRRCWLVLGRPLPSRAESFGIVFLEAWTFAVPVVEAEQERCRRRRTESRDC
jgi:glycosyltransferase involved in cell wall biosynthesis